MRHFSSEQTTAASRDAVWNVWKAVSAWHEWDSELVNAALDTAFVQGGHGTLTPKGARPSRFIITELTDGTSFTFVVPLPMARLQVAHYFRAGAVTTFIHEVTFTGLLGGMFGQLLGRRYRAALPAVLMRIAALAERKSLT
jgi:hypothetical protein